MYLSATEIVKNVLTSNSRELSEAEVHEDNNDHRYIRGDIENRGPCPGLNALANQGYL